MMKKKPYRTKKLNQARSALLSVLAQAKDRKAIARFVPPADPLAELAKRVRMFLKKGRLKFHEKRADNHVYFNGFIGFHNAVFDHYAFLLTLTLDRISSFVTLPGHVPEKARPAVLDFLARINWDAIWGSVKLDLRDGEVSHVITLSCAALKGDDLDFEIERLLWIPLAAFWQMSAPLAKLMLGQQTSPRAAFREWQMIGMKARHESDSDDCDCEEDGEDGALEDLGSPDTPDADAGEDASSSASDSRSLTVFRKIAAYSIDVLNVQSKISLDAIVAGAKRFQSGVRVEGIDAPRFSLLLSGPPGSGKSAFARHLAHKIGAPLIEARGSDLISALVGQTERNLAEKFKEASSKHAVLFLDEVDSLLWSRAAATHAWEASEVNELLGQLERASCIVIGATNYADHFDSAVLRRFTFKVTLDYSTDVGKELLFKRLFKLELNAKQRERLASIPNLCPGDFRTAREGLFYVKEKPTADDYLEALEKESEAKTEKISARIGF